MRQRSKLVLTLFATAFFLLTAGVWLVGNLERLTPVLESEVVQQGPIEVHILPPVTAEHYLEGADWQLKRELGAAFTQWAYICKTDFDFEEVKEVEGRRFILRPSHISVELSLPITVWLPFGVSKELHDHELGHSEICRRIYLDARSIVLQQSQALMQKSFVITAPSLPLAKEKASEQCHALLVKSYRDQTDRFAYVVSDRYDAITKHGMNGVPSEKAVAQAFQESRRETLSPDSGR